VSILEELLNEIKNMGNPMKIKIEGITIFNTTHSNLI
jgi:hypothetical protein